MKRRASVTFLDISYYLLHLLKIFQYLLRLRCHGRQIVPGFGPPTFSAERIRSHASSRQCIGQGPPSYYNGPSELLKQLGFGGAAAMAYVLYRGELNGPDGFGDLPSDDEHSERRRILTKQLFPYLNELLQVSAGSFEIPAAVVDNLNVIAVHQTSK